MVCESGFGGPLQDDTAVGITVGPGQSEAGGSDCTARQTGLFEGRIDGGIEILHGEQRAHSPLIGGAGKPCGKNLRRIGGSCKQCSRCGTTTINTQQQ